MFRIMRILVATIALALFGAPASAQDPARHGRALLKEFCGSCHAVSLRDRSRHKGAPPFRTLGRSFDLDDFPRLLARGVSSGHPDMPEFRFSSEDARDVRAYLRTIQQ
jgi:cytochrome c